ncbi:MULTISPECIES: phosphonate C-P lyase system protein PhnG [unclassified Chelatococcus]|uniref:phosphonate C-P lyase system protein PhnG n=1 Tax=unclassified Chelatococcus TaxID=2638111 RepID=UPI001BCC110A|nr:MULTISPECIES: phosphonate C-P lyase system protein PhnG [unclassified Chelatococcus]CAH1663308.1 carbon-phosphorus lyase core complex subunit PhnG [Hyphomicrobiales bacterium]MBS7741556.1 phosphonate C-P lyase system protein PhnG [Chelatococcus sp. HY11]MBX3544425.1 phosphonate C-P lyase system protein PhnG [Chelatococcus sp.]MCO5079052.1 phosphonate C-P lyase system protein PhnG [Chelatococcus sp.]CAH1682298.1 carbon-phosphorus lyase core complex subunit PhnG [Hyphomicrobiales bacterium]
MRAAGHGDDAGDAARRSWLSVLARAPRDELEAAFADVPECPEHRFLRQPEIGLVMVQGRAGGSGNAFNLGEMTVTRCALQLADGTIGLGYVQGRDRRRAEIAAIIDALLQVPERRADLETVVIAPLAAAQAARRDARSRKAASTKVEFFTMVRGDNPR